MNPNLLCLIPLAVALVGCTTSDLPRGARLVGGGLLISYAAPTDGTAILIERNTRRIVTTESITETSTFEFGHGRKSNYEVLFRMFAPSNSNYTEYSVFPIPTNTFFQLYFVPKQPKKE